MLSRVVALAALGGFLFGYDLGLIGGAILGISNAFNISNATKEAIVGATKLGAFFGTFLGGVAMLRYGRRKAIGLQAAFFVGGPVIMAVAPGPAALVVGRLVVGFGIGASAIVVPAYLAEIAPAKNRGMVVQMYEVMLTLGMLCAVLINLGLNAAVGPAAWRWMVGLPAVPGAFLLASLVILPESPRWLVMRGQLDQALATLHSIIASSSSKNSRSSRGPASRRRRWRSRQAAAAAAAAGLPHDDDGAAAAGGTAAVAEDAAWLNAAAAAERGVRSPRSEQQQALDQAEDELLLLWSSVQKEQAAGLELRQAAAAAGGAAAGCTGGSPAGSNGGGTHAAADARVVVSRTPTTAATAAVAGGGGVHGSNADGRFAAQAAPNAAFTLDDSEDYQTPKGHLGGKLQGQAAAGVQVESDTAGVDAVGVSGSKSSSSSSGGGVTHTKFKALQQKLHLTAGRGGSNTRDVVEGSDADIHQQQQQQLLDPAAVRSSDASTTHRQQQQQQGEAHSNNHHHHHHHQQQQQGTQQPAVEPGQEANVFASLWSMLVDIKAVARGPERGAFAIACCLAVFDQATASTAIINYAPEVLSSTLGVQDPNLAILYPAAIAWAKVVGTLVAAATVDKYGRKPLLAWGGVACAVFLGVTGVALAVGSVPLYLASLCLFIFSFSTSWAGLYWVVVSEIFSMGAKSPATSAATSLLFLTGAVVNFVYLSMIQWMGGAALCLFGVIAVCSAWYVWARVPETKGKTLTDIQALLAPPSSSRGGSPSSPTAGFISPHGCSVSARGWRGGAGGAAGVNGGGGGSDCGSPMLPIAHQQQPFSTTGARGHEGLETGLVDLRELMVMREGHGHQQQQQPSAGAV